MPGQPLLVELDNCLRTLGSSQLGGDQVGLVGSLPLDHEHDLAVVVRGGHDFFHLKCN